MSPQHSADPGQRTHAHTTLIRHIQKAKDMSRVEMPITQFQTTQIKAAKVRACVCACVNPTDNCD
jgi:hypothetical protein